MKEVINKIIDIEKQVAYCNTRIQGFTYKKEKSIAKINKYDIIGNNKRSKNYNKDRINNIIS